MASLALSEVGRALDGALALFIERPAPPGSFDVSIGGFWRSFAALILIAPSVLVSMAASATFTGGDAVAAALAPTPSEVIMEAASVLCDWIALPLVLGILARPLGISGRYVPFVVVRNWASVVGAAVTAFPALLFNLGLLGQEAFVILMLVTAVAVLRYHYRVARIVLAAPVSLAVGIVGLDIALGLVIEQVFIRFLGG